ncbi:MAG TPA: hypothetical protein VIT65_02745 [Microlunatus sp.]
MSEVRFRLPGKTSTPRVSRWPSSAAAVPAPVDTVEPEPDLFDEEDLPPSAMAGAPGTFVPDDFRPRTVAEMAQVVPIPVGPWSEGQSMKLSSGNHAHWNGSAWRSGKAPAVDTNAIL